MMIPVALIQAGFSVGNVAFNVARIAVFYRMAVIAKAQLVVFSEMAITGYPPEDLVLSAQFQDRSMAALVECAAMTADGPAMLIGSLWREDGALYNAVFLLENGKIAARQYKNHLPNTGVFDEQRTFMPGVLPEPMVWRSAERTLKLGVLICEDMWFPDIARHLKDNGAQLLISVNASPFETGKPHTRERFAAQRVEETGLALLYVNQIGGHDELVFDGHSFVMDAHGQISARLDGFREDFQLVHIACQGDTLSPVAMPVAPLPAASEMIYRAIVLGLREFVTKNGFVGIVLGMSGGIDSALCGALAVDAVGRERVRTVMLPSPFTSADSVEDARQCAQRLGVRIDTVSIAPGMQAFDAALSSAFGGQLTEAATRDNQPRLRGSILMAISLKDNLLLLNTGNKSEMAVGYTTLYGDMCGHYAAIKDIYKTTVYEIAAWRNTQSDVIPQRIFTKAPTAELFHGQTDQDLLPPYAVLDQILFHLIEERRGVPDIVARGFDRAMVEEVSGMLYRAEHKRRQSAPGVRISSMSFWRDRRYPISNGWPIEHLTGPLARPPE